MITEIDTQTLALLRGLVGRTIRQIAGLPYPGMAGYSELWLVDDIGRCISLKLRTVDVSDELEVCVPTAELTQGLKTGSSVDLISVSGFRVAHVYRLQRRESLATWTADDGQYVGSDPREQLLTGIGADDVPGGDVVDAGVAFESGEGVSVECYADSFPLVLQLRLAVASSPVPTPKRVSIA